LADLAVGRQEALSDESQRRKVSSTKQGWTTSDQPSRT
jgi:hypothetical protein